MHSARRIQVSRGAGSSCRQTDPGDIVTADADKAHTVAGLGFCRGSGRVSYGDALLWASARDRRPARVYSFDQRFPGDEIEVTAPPLAGDEDR